LTDLGFLYTARGLDLRWNGLWTDDADVDAFVDQRHSSNGDWPATQTIAPTNVAVSSSGDSTVWLTWDAIAFASDDGGYEALVSDSPTDGDWRSGGWTHSKLETSFPVTGLVAGTAYGFAIRTFTWPHDDNRNTVVSEFSTTVTATTRSDGCRSPAISRTGVHPVNLSLPNSYSTYSWNTGETGPSIEVDPTEPTWYWVTVTWAGSCEETAGRLIRPLPAGGTEEPALK